MRQNKDFISPEESVTKKIGLQFFAVPPEPPPFPPEPTPPSRYHHIDLYKDGEFIKQYITEIYDNAGSPPINNVTALWYYYKDNILYLYVGSAFGYTPDIEEVIDNGDKYEDISNNYIRDEESGTFITVEDLANNLYVGGPSSGAYDEKRLDIFSSAPSGYSITYHPDDGTPTPEDLTGQTALPDPLPTISKSNYIFNGWYLDSAFDTPAIAGATISANTDLYAKFTEDTRIHCDLTQLAGWADLSAGQHTITVKAKASGYRDSEPSTGVTVTKAEAYQYTQEGSVVTLLNAPYFQTGSEVTIL